MSECKRAVPANGHLVEASVSCPDCGHTMLVHPGIHNLGVNQCMLCQLASAAPAPSAVEELARAILDGRVHFGPTDVRNLSDGYDTKPYPLYSIEVEEP